jgi:NitT/TauT family transport system substrate-binding protein
METKQILVIAASAVLLVAFVLLFFQNNDQEQTIKVAYLPVVQSLPLFVAMEQGMFEEEGLKVEAVRIASPNQIVDGLISGKVDAGAPSVASGIAAISELKSPDSLQIYAFNCGTLEHLNDELLVAKDSDIQSVQGLKGKKLGHLPGVQFSTVAKKILIENDVDPSEVTLVELPVPSQLATLGSGGVDAVLTLEPVGTVGAEKNISRILVANPMVRHVSDPWCGGAGVVTTRFMEERPEEAQAFIRVMNRAIIEARENASTKQYLVQYLDMPESVVEKTPMPLMLASDDIDEEIVQAYQQFVDVFYELEVTDESIDVKKLMAG